MAVARLHNVPDFARPFFRESPQRDSHRWDDDHCGSSTRASTLLQMWRAIEGENVISQSRRSTSTSIGHRSENGDDSSQVSDEYENQSSTCSESEHGDNSGVISEQSSEFGEIERGRVRQVFREWTNICPEGQVPYEFSRKDFSGRCVGDRDSETVHNELVINHPVIRARRPLRRLCGRQTLLDLILKAQNERKGELLSLSEQRPVSDFAHRNRIQALLRGRFLRNGGVVLDEGRPSSVAATELGFLRQRHAVSDLRVGFLSKLDNSASASVNCDSSYNDGNKGESTCTEGEEMSQNHIAADLEVEAADGNSHVQELEVHHVEAENPILADEGSQEDTPVCATNASSREQSSLALEATHHEIFTRTEHINANVTNELLPESADINRIGSSEVNIENDEPMSGVSSSHEVSDTTTDLEENPNEEYDSHDVEESRGWPSHDLHEAVESWLDIPSGESGESTGEIDTLYFSYEDNANSMELRELFSRRRVSSLLGSSFRENLDRVLQSHAERLGNASVEWEIESTSFPPLIEQDQEELNAGQSHSGSDERNTYAQSSALFEAQQLRSEDLLEADWPHHYSDQPLETEWDVVRIDMARLQERMNSVQGMLEACMDMQIELQQSLHQEVSAALYRSSRDADVDACKNNQVDDESRWDNVKRGICCLCQHSRIDSLLYRCGHMCTCANCAEALVQSKGKCPMCRAPAVEAVRAYFIQ